ncbi:phage portal protein [Rhizobium rhizogenes]|uniref:phage portal protein n=1 Tax=Rhizobium rhizogenes TaxID=359 RepID=UPI0004D99585|nr:phage portal protein [Rhizobium rhizogenes]KEA07490.1 histone H1 [Rhizobium rhizogenes]NTJ22237.1 phage portal protein [Rhizobium rhizogenes]QUE80955.1 phage portal protein [Rhizobium rhizogenes]TQO80939.1 phage portal protein [Rhizobium rhizogenes]TRB51533.1 phage portal protein [Rhizobium rhizogenes]
MGIIARLLGRKAEEKSVSFDPVWLNWFGSRVSKSGVDVSWERALDVSTVFACIRVIAEGVAQVPLRVMQELPNGKGSMPAVDHPLYKVLNRKPNKWQSSFALRETMIFHLALTGNAFFYKNMVRGQVRELIPIDPGCVTITRNTDYSLTYTVSGIDGRSMDFPQSLIWHIRGPSWDTWRGLDAVRQAREAIGLTIATENTQAEMHANGLQASGTYSTDQKLDPEKYKQIQAWIAAQTGGANRHKPFVIDSNFQWKQQTMTGVDAEHLSTRKFQIEEICRSFRVLPPMVGHSGQSMTFASAEQIFLAHVIHTLMPWVVRIEQSIDNDLLDGTEDEGFFAKFNMNSLMRGAAADRATFYSKALGSGGSPAWMTQDEVRAAEDLNAEGGEASKLPKPTNVAGSKLPAKPNTGQQDQNT